MSDAFQSAAQAAFEDDDDTESPLPQGQKNYMTPAGHRRMRAEFEQLLRVERPHVVQIVSWAASNGDRSENGDYLYGKRRLREIDRRLRYLSKRLDAAEVVHPGQQDPQRVFFGATVQYLTEEGDTQEITIVGLDELDPARRYVSWVSPIARALTKAALGDCVSLRTPKGVEELEIVGISYQALEE